MKFRVGWQGQGLANLKFSYVCDFVHLQEIGHGDFIALGDGRQSFAFGHDMDGAGGGIGSAGRGGGGGLDGEGLGRRGRSGRFRGAGSEAGRSGDFAFEQEVEAGDFLGQDVDLPGLLLKHLVESLELVSGRG